MLLQIQLPKREDTVATNRLRWAELQADAKLADCPNRIETNAWGQIIMSPPPTGSHCKKQFRIAQALERLLGGEAFTECPISTADGVKAADAAWFSDQRYAQVVGQDAFEIAPEICVEVLSPKNTWAEMQAKRQLYFDAGAIECWTCDLTGQMTYYSSDEPESPKHESKLCPQFPGVIKD